MKSLFAQILAWFFLAIVITMAGTVLLQMLGDNAAGAHSFVTDSNGRDIVSGADHSLLVKQARDARFPIVRENSVSYFVSRDVNGNWFFIERRDMSGWRWLQPLFPLIVMLGLCYLLARHLTAPLRGLEGAVERFGKGDFTARVNSKRRDELGQLTRTFDQMAERLQSLLEKQNTLLRDISHELRSPLTRLGLAVELARSGSDKDQALDRIEKEADRVNELVEELLSLTRIENQQAAPVLTPTRVDEMLEDLVDICAVEASAGNSRLVLKCDGPITVDADEDLLRRAVENVIRNAVRYAPANTEIQVAAVPRNGDVHISIRDFGPGVPNEALPRIFEPFYRVDSARNRETGGAGLGLAIAQRAIAVNRGKISARNANPGLEIEIDLQRSN